MKRVLKRFDERALKLVLAAFFLALALPAGVLIVQAYGQLKWQAFRSTQVAAEELAARVDATLRAAIGTEDARSFGAYSFLVVEGDAAANFVQRSPLSAFPVESAIPGVLGYFQVDAAGKLTTPLLPEAGVAASNYGIAPGEEAARAERVAQVRDLLVRNQLVRGPRDEPAPAPAEVERERSQRRLNASSPASASASFVQEGFDRLSVDAPPLRRAVGARDDDAGAAREVVAPAAPSVAPPAAQLVTVVATFAEQRQKRLEQSLVAEPAAEQDAAELGAVADAKAEVSVRMFASEVDPFELGVLDDEHLVLFRNVWRDGQRYVQGALVERAAFVMGVIDSPYRASNVGSVARLNVDLQGRPWEVFGPLISSEENARSTELTGTVLHRARLSPPFGDLELAFVVDRLPRAPGTALLAWVAVTLGAVLVGGFIFMYRFGVGQMRLARQQQDFVSAVSHELKTPLTSIRMYGEMLKAGWADDAKRQTYYDYIHSESERLSRLIENVLQLARLTRNTQRFDLRSVTVAELLDLVRSKVATQVERAGFTLTLRNETPEGTAVVADADCFAQIFINLVDNALKFSAGATTKTVEIAARRGGDGKVLLTVRDFGPGVPKTQMKKIFELFYRAENELTRETVGTGIGLALVRQLAAAMDARVDVRNCEPGAEFRLQFPPAATG
ncbi:MAG TPA: HAMP domain-containing sensor histidine kinase [Gammaproteobacteria bacterium]|nr:HAMP domain-containing sensor histidine kinase [Gammaproteobacteria bacterium]